jgi:hypothetical protein
MADDDKHDHTMLGAQNLAGSTECHTLEAQTIMLDAQNLAGNFADATERHTLCAQNTMLGAQNTPDVSSFTHWTCRTSCWARGATRLARRPLCWAR